MTPPLTTTGSLAEAMAARDDADPPTNPGRREARAERRAERESTGRVRGEGWRSVVTGAVGSAAIVGLTAAGLEVEKAAPWLTLIVALVVAGKDAKAIVALMADVWAGRRGGG